MRKVTDFIVKYRNIILAVFIGLAGLSLILMDNVKINHDMTAYLPKDSETRIGMDLMDEEFEPEETSALSLMVKGLDEEAKTKTLNYLKSLDGVKSINYDNTDAYNRGDQTLYEITVDGLADSATAKKVYTELEQHFAEQEIAMSGEVMEQNKTVLPFWIVALAVGCALIILIIMSDSYVEPFLFLFTILIAILLNKGTNIIFPTVSNVTDSITAILQLALSMDYSIMLMERFRQERITEKDNVKAMKNALFAAFKSISSSSVTTIVGLLALVFMSFTIGKDLGFVLAKGVLFSLIAIFTCLPALILMFDKLITKTKKHCPHFSLKIVGHASYKLRYVAILVFILVFGGSLLTKGGLTILYTDSEQDEIAKVFNEKNQMAIIYQNQGEEKIAKYCQTLEKKLPESEILCYGNTINQNLAAEDFNAKLKDLEVETEIDDYLLKILYYNYYSGDKSYELTFNEFVNFIQTEVYKNDNLAEHLDAKTRKNVEKLSNFSNKTKVQKKRSSAELANLLGIKSSKVDDLLIYYNSKNIKRKISVSDFTNFLENYVFPSKKYGTNFDQNAKNQLRQVSTFTDKNLILADLDSTTMANLFGLDATIVQSLYLYNLNLTNPTALNPTLANPSATPTNPSTQLPPSVLQSLAMSPYDFVNFILAHQSDPALSGKLDKSTLKSLEVLQKVMSYTAKNHALTPSEMSNLLGIPTDDAKLLYSLYEIKWQGKNVTVSLMNFVDFLTNDVMKNPKYSKNFDTSARQKIPVLHQIIQGTLKNQHYTNDELYNKLKTFASDLDKNLVKLLYLYHGSQHNYNSAWKLSVENLVNYANDDILPDPTFKDFIDDEMKDKLADAKEKIKDAKEMLVGKNYSRAILNTKFPAEGEKTFKFIKETKADLAEIPSEKYMIGNSLMAHEMSLSFGGEMDYITVLTMIFIFLVVAFTFKSIIIPILLVLLIQSAVYLTMGIMSIGGGTVYFIALLIVQSILMGATIDYAILYTSYYIESRATRNVRDSIVNAYDKAIHGIMTSGLILIIATFMVGQFASGITSKICLTLAKGTTCAIVIILVLLPALLGAFDKLVMRGKRKLSEK